MDSASQVALVVKNLSANAGDIRDAGLIPGLGRSLGRGHGNPVFLPRESHGQRSLAGYSPWGHKESDTTEVTTHKQNSRRLQVLHSRACFHAVEKPGNRKIF